VTILGTHYLFLKAVSNLLRGGIFTKVALRLFATSTDLLKIESSERKSERQWLWLLRATSCCTWKV